MCEILFTLSRDAHGDRQFRAPGTCVMVRADGFAWPQATLAQVAAEQMGLLKLAGVAVGFFEDMDRKDRTFYQDPRTGAQMVRYEERRIDLTIVLPIATKVAAGTWTITRQLLRNTTDAICNHSAAGPLASSPTYMRA